MALCFLFSSTELRILELITHNFTGKQILLLHIKYLHISPFIPTPSSGLKNPFVYNSYMFRLLYQCQHQDKKLLFTIATCFGFYTNASIRIKKTFVYNSYVFRLLYQCQHQDKKLLFTIATCFGFYTNASIRIKNFCLK